MLELETRVKRRFAKISQSITTRAFSWLKEPTIAFTLLRHYDKQAFNQEKAQVLPDYELHVDLRNEASFEALVWL